MPDEIMENGTMDNVLASLPSKVSPVALAAGGAVALKVGKMNIAAELGEIYLQEDADDSKVKRIMAIAQSGITCEEFNKGCKTFQNNADEMDRASGFKPADDAKGSEKYGPKRRVANQRLSEARMIFGAYKLEPSVVIERGYWSALDAARTYLSEVGCKWDGTKVEDSEKKAARKNAKMYGKAQEEVMTNHPQQAGESILQYQERVAELVEDTLLEMEQEAQTEAFNKVVKSLEEKYGWDFVVSLADRIMVEDENRTAALATQHDNGEAAKIAEAA